MISQKWQAQCLEMFRMVSREEWGAVPAKHAMPQQSIPNSTFYTTYAKTTWCKDDDDCKKVVQNLQQKHMSEGYPDIQYNFLIGGDGNVYEGAGWNNTVVDFFRPEMNPHPKIIIATLGKPTESRYMRRVVRANDRFLRYGVKNKFLKYGEKFKYRLAPPL